MYSIVLTDGKIINVNADGAEWCEKARMVRFRNKNRTVARINMENVVGWVDAEELDKAESEE